MEILRTQAIKPWLWKRFIDLLYLDIFCRKSEQVPKRYLNEFHPNLKLTFENSKNKIIFLDLFIKVTDGKSVTDLFCKSMNSHQYLLYDSRHAEHIKRSTQQFFNQTLQLSRICSQKSDSQLKELKSWFGKKWLFKNSS